MSADFEGDLFRWGRFPVDRYRLAPLQHHVVREDRRHANIGPEPAGCTCDAESNDVSCTMGEAYHSVVAFRIFFCFRIVECVVSINSNLVVQELCPNISCKCHNKSFWVPFTRP